MAANPEILMEREDSLCQVEQTETAAADEWDETLRAAEREHTKGCISRLIIYEEYRVRHLYQFVLAILLVYTGTLFPYTLCFQEFRLDVDDSPPPEKSSFYAAIELIVDILFWGDLFINFFLTYTTQQGVEVDNLGLIAKRYLKKMFFVNLIACLPESFFRLIIQFFAENTSTGHSLNKLARLARLQRVSRLSRLVRLGRLMHLVPFMTRTRLWKWFGSMKGIRIVNFVGGLLWAVHLLACGWYLCAVIDSYHHTPEETWVGRRGILHHGEGEQWLHSMYFVLTVFTTVGFGDMSAFTNIELCYVCFTMLMGTIVHSMIMSEVITIVTSVDHRDVAAKQHRELIEAFTKHSEIDKETKWELDKWIRLNSSTLDDQFDPQSARNLLFSGRVPLALMERMPWALFKGELVKNQFLSTCLTSVPQLPPRFAILVSLHVNKRIYEAGEVVYQLHDHPFNLYLVMDGTFAYIGRPKRRGRCGFEDDAPIQSQIKDAGDWAAGLAAMEMKNSAKGGSQGEKSSPTKDKKDGKSEVTTQKKRLFPYQLLSARTYFGDIEIIFSGARRCSVRCESPKALALMMSTKDFFRLLGEFPHFEKAWKSAARRRETYRSDRKARCTEGLAFHIFAAVTIQRLFRKHLAGTLSQRKQKPTHPIQVQDENLQNNRAYRNNVQSGGDIVELRADVDALRQELREGLAAMHGVMDEVRRAVGAKTPQNHHRFPL